MTAPTQAVPPACRRGGHVHHAPRQPATTATVRSPERYRQVVAFEMRGDAREAAADVLAAAGYTVWRCRRGGLVVSGRGARYRITDEPGAPPLTVRAVMQLLGDTPVAASA